MLRVFRLNAPEWLYMVVGCFFSLINGATQPAFAMVLAEVIGVSHRCCVYFRELGYIDDNTC